METTAESDFMTRFRGRFESALRWHNLDELWLTVRNDAENWYIYQVGADVPTDVSSAARLNTFIDELDELLRAEHQEDYCGIVYADDLRAPTMIKVYDPNNLGVSCGFSDNPPTPGWVISRVKPVAIGAERVVPAGRRRWWRRFLRN